MATKKRWTEAQTIKFVQLYEDAECLWNFRHALYKNKDARDAACRNMILQMGIPGFDTNDLKNKIKNIRSTCTQELCKRKRGIKSGMSPDEEYVSHLPWFKTANRFLQKVINTREHFSNHSEEIAESGASQTEQGDRETEADETSIIGSDSEINATQSNTQDSQNTCKIMSLCSRPIDLGHKRPMEESTAVSPTQPGTSHSNIKQPAPASSSRNAKKRFSNTKETPPMHITNAIQSLQELKRSVETKEEDEFSFFGNNVASQLRQLPLDIALYCQSRIMTLLTDQRIAVLQRSHSFSRHSTSASTSAEISISENISTSSVSPWSPQSVYTNSTSVTDQQYQDFQETNAITAAIRSIGGIDALHDENI